MIQISNIAQQIEKFLMSINETKFKIYMRIDFSIDVYVLTNSVVSSHTYQHAFSDYLQKQSEENPNGFCHKFSDNLKINFTIIDEETVLDDPFYENMFSDAFKNEIIDWGPRYRFDSLLQKNKGTIVLKKEQSPTPVVTFYSYKGGMGRTTTMIAYALSLAANSDVAKKRRVVIIDCDLEAPGYLNFFDLSEHEGLRSGKKNGLVEYISDAQFVKNPEDLDINDYIINVGLDNKNSFAYKNLDNIWLVPAGNLNEGYSDAESSLDRNDYLEGLAKINLSNVKNVVKYFELLFNEIKKTLNPDVILVDSRTGFNDIFGTAAFYLSDCVVGFFGFSRQTQPGLINLLKEYYKEANSFKLKLVFSILPENVPEEWVEKHKQEVLQYMNFVGTESKDTPSFLYLHRNALLEKIGTGDEKSDSAFVDFVVKNKSEDYKSLFDQINDLYFINKQASLYTSNTSAIQLRNLILKRLKEALENVKNFAEDTKIDEKQFFYRDCMKDLFNSKKFIIQGYKGSGKTYLYKALADKNIANNIQKWAKNDPTREWAKSDVLEPIFVNILPTSESALVFNSIRYSDIEEPEFYFSSFWQIYTWNVLLLNSEFEAIKEESELCDEIQQVAGASYANEALLRIDGLIKKGVAVLVSIQKDIAKINDYLCKSNKRLFVLYDRLDTYINPLKWNVAVSPLINYWRNNCMSYSNISPKIFIRTDLFKMIEGTNTARLENSIIDIKWTIGEVFGFFFKLIFSDPDASEAYWAIEEKLETDKNYIKNTKSAFGKFPKNQLDKYVKQTAMEPLIKVFFGKWVQVGSARLGTPREYFEKELANADNTAISLRPFINTLGSNAVDKALARTEKHVTCIIPSDIYASKSVRDDATEKYFADLTQDAFSKDLLRFKEVIRTSVGEPFRFKSLTETQFEELISITFSRIGDSPVVKSPEDLKRLIFANGIMAEKITTNGRYYRFAPIYWYSWGLVNSSLENEEKRKPNNKVKVEVLIPDNEYEGIVVVNGSQKKVKCEEYKYPLEMRGSLEELYEDDEVFFIAKSEPNHKDNRKKFWYATNIRLKDK